MYEPYANANDYATFGGGAIPDENIEKYLHRASRNIDTLTYNRIIALGFEKLTEFQRDIVKESCCLFADFIFENFETLNCALNSYSVNGVSMSFGGITMAVINGVPISRDIYSLLGQSGLCTANMNWRRAIRNIRN